MNESMCPEEGTSGREGLSIEALYGIFKAHPVITTDTRKCTPGSLFFALKGERFNGNRFALQALEAGCAYAVVDEEIGASENPQFRTDNSKPDITQRILRVDNVLTTLQALAHYHRMQFSGPVIQITGTNGKTTTKELVASVLSSKWNVTFTQGNLNNHIGVPLTLLSLPFDCQTSPQPIAVVETGANHPGEIAALSRIVSPDCGLITNVGRAHLEGFGSFEGVVATKTELYANLRQKEQGFIFLHADNPHLAPKAEGLKRITYGQPGHGYDAEGKVEECNPFVKMHWRTAGEDWHTVQTQLIGAYNIDNLLAAVAVGLHFGVSPEQIDCALAQYTPRLGRSELKHTASNTLIVDAYNANLTSMQAALENFRQIPHPHKMAILGEMRELGAASADAHLQILQQALCLDLEELWVVGKEFSQASLPAIQPNLPEAGRTDGLRFFTDVEEVKAALAAVPVADRLILIKGSNGTHLYELPDLL